MSADRHFCFVLEPASISERENVVGVWVSLVDVYEAGQASYQKPFPSPEVVPTPTSLPQADQPASAFDNKIFLPLILRGEPQSRYDNVDVGFQLHYSGRPIETVTTFLTYLAKDKSYFWGIPAYYVFLFVIYLVMVVLLSDYGNHLHNHTLLVVLFRVVDEKAYTKVVLVRVKALEIATEWVVENYHINQEVVVEEEECLK